MSDTKKKAPIFTTPVGRAHYPRILGEPDTKFKPEGVWSVKAEFQLSDPAVSKMLDRFEQVISEAKNNAKADQDYMLSLKKRKKALAEADRSFVVDEDAGTVTVNFKMTASGKSKKTGKAWERRPAVFGADNTPIDPQAKVGSGSEVRVAYTCEPFYTAVGYGCSIRLEAVQVVKLVEWGMDAGAFGFEAAMDADEDADAEDGTEEAAAPDAGEDDF